jgi:hypothetical protein
MQEDAQDNETNQEVKQMGSDESDKWMVDG